MAIPLLGPRKSVSDATLDNSGDGRGLSGQRGCQTRGRRSPTGNQQWLAGARSRNFSRPDRSLCKRRERRDRAGRPCAYHQGTRSQPYQQAHLPQVGYVPAKGGQTVSCPRMAPKIAYGPKNQRPYSGSHVPPLREGHALGTDSPGTQPDLVELKGVSKRLKAPRILTEEQFGSLLNQLVHPYRCMVLLAGCTGLRISEVMGLRWSLIDFESLVMEV